MHSWFYADSQNQQRGPVDSSWLISAYQRGELRGNTLVWREGLAAWTPLSQVAGELGVPIAAAPPPMPGRAAQSAVAKPSSGGIWVIVIIVVIFGVLFIGGILAAIAIPAYSDYVQRAKVAQALVQAGELKIEVTEFFLRENRCLRNGEGTVKAAESYATPVIAAIRVGAIESGECGVRLVFKDLGGRGTEGKEVLMTMDAKRAWHTTSNLPDRYLPMSLRQSRAR